MAFHLISLPRHIYRVGWGDDPLALAPLEILASHPGRWDDLRYRFRTGYYGDSLVSCFIEVLAGLRPDPATVATLSAMHERPPDMDAAIREALASKFASVLITQENRVVDIVHPQSRSEFEQRTRRRKRVKVGDFLGVDLRIPRRAAGIAFEGGHSGVAAPSAEALSVDSRTEAFTYNLFETELYSGAFRIALVSHAVRPAVEQTIDIASARDFLGL